MITNLQKAMSWVQNWCLRPSEIEVQEAEIKRLDKLIADVKAQNESLQASNELVHRECLIYKAYQESMDEHAKMTFDTF